MVVEVSADDPRLDDYRHVADHALLTSRGLFLAEGRMVVRRLIASPRFWTKSVLVTPAALADLADLVLPESVPIFVADQEVLNGVAGINFHRGCLAVGIREPALPWRDTAAHVRTAVVLERIANPDNMGGIFRNAAAFGIDAVLMDATCVDPLYRKAIRTSMGASLRVPFAHMRDWPDDLTRLRELGFTLVALTPAESAPRLDSVRPSGDRIALLLGHEGFGLSKQALRKADVHARIPMSGDVDSLNVATAAGIALYELRRSA